MLHQWKDKFLKVLQKCKNTEERRAALKKAVDVLMKQVNMMQDENLKLKKGKNIFILRNCIFDNFFILLIVYWMFCSL